MNFAAKLWNRRVVKFGAFYLGAAWLVLQVAAQLEATLELPNWVDQAALAFLGLGFPLVLILAWAQESRAPKGVSLEGVTGEAGPRRQVLADSRTAQLPAAPTTEPLLAVLPFDNLSNDEEMQFFSDGVSEEILGRLARGSKLKVIGRVSSFQFRGDDKSKAASVLNATHVFDGSIRRAEGRVRVAAHLVETKGHTTLWSERYDRKLEDIFALQDEISDAIADALHQTFTRLTTGVVDPAVYDLFLRASPRTYAPDDLRSKVGLLEPATQQESDFAAAWGRLAFLRSVLRTYEPYATRAESGARIAKEAERALSLDPQNVEALAARYFVIPAFGHFAEAEQVMEKIQQAPGLAEPKLSVGMHFVGTGRAREASDYNERLYRNDPLNLFLAHRFATGQMTLGLYHQAISVFEEILTREPGLQLAATTLVRAHAFNEDWAAVDRLMDPEKPLPWFDSAAFVRAKRHPSTENIAEWCQALMTQFERTGCVDASQLAQAANLGLLEEAYKMAETAHFGPPGTDDDITDPDAYRTALLFHAGMPELRADPRFIRLCARLGLVEFWLTTNKWPDCVDEVPYDFKAECEKARNTPKQPFLR